jgi:hypothetical protein
VSEEGEVNSGAEQLHWTTELKCRPNGGAGFSTGRLELPKSLSFSLRISV